MKRLLILLLAVASALMPGCRRAPIAGGTVTAESAGIEERDFSLGVGFIPRHYPNPTEDDFRDVFERAHETGGILMFQGAWRDSPEKSGEISELVHVGGTLSQTYHYEPLIDLQFFAGNETNPIPLLDMPGNPENSWRNPEARERFKQTAVKVAQKFHPKWLILGIEVNLYWEAEQKGKVPAGDFDRFVQVFQETREAVKAVSPRTKVLTTFQLETMKGMEGVTDESGELTEVTFNPAKTQWHLLQKFEDRADLIAFTTIPYLVSLVNPNPEAIPENYYSEIKEHTNLPVAFTEISWISEEQVPQPFDFLHSSEQEQAAFIPRFFDLTKSLLREFVVWVYLHDNLTESPANPRFGFTAGLKRNDGTKKPAFFAWQKWANKR